MERELDDLYKEKISLKCYLSACQYQLMLERATEVLQSRICGRKNVTETLSEILCCKNIRKGIQDGILRTTIQIIC